MAIMTKKSPWEKEWADLKKKYSESDSCSDGSDEDSDYEQI